MNKTIGLISKVVVIAAIVGIVTGCNRVPFLGRNQSANQTGNSQTATQAQRSNRTRVQRASQPTRQAQTTNQTNTQAPAATVNTGDANADSGQSDSNQGVSALW